MKRKRETEVGGVFKNRFELVSPENGVNVDASPFCEHGPTLLFERKEGSNEGERFFACSAFRDRKECSFFLKWTGKKDDHQEKEGIDGLKGSSKASLRSHSKFTERLEVFLLLTKEKRRFCCDCSSLLMPEEWKDHVDHRLKSNVTGSDIMRPTKLLQPLENNKKEAQYFFAKRTLNFISKTIRTTLRFKRVICLGSPSIHEHIQSHREEWVVSSILLDIDARFMQFYLKGQFLQFNMFNGYFFGGNESKKCFQMYLKNSKFEELVIIVDPPFGGLMEALAASIKSINQLSRKYHKTEEELPVLLFSPYFLSKRIVSAFPSLESLDYKVEYRNHRKFSEKGQKQGSPVRIFTNIPRNVVILPESQGYKLCTLCDRYVSAENKHCFECKACTSRDGRPSVHCRVCGRCVKNSWTHCSVCGRCALPHQHQQGRSAQAGPYTSRK